MAMRLQTVSLLAFAAGVAAAPRLSAASLPDIGLKQLATFAGTPTDIRNAGDGSDRLFLATQAGKILIYSGGVVLPNPFLDIRDKVINDPLRGLLGVAFHPGYVDNGFFYVHYV